MAHQHFYCQQHARARQGKAIWQNSCRRHSFRTYPPYRNHGSDDLKQRNHHRVHEIYKQRGQFIHLKTICGKGKRKALVCNRILHRKKAAQGIRPGQGASAQDIRQDIQNACRLRCRRGFRYQFRTLPSRGARKDNSLPRQGD